MSRKKKQDEAIEAAEAAPVAGGFYLLSSSALIQDLGSGDRAEADSRFRRCILLPSTKLALLALDRVGSVSYSDLRSLWNFIHVEADEAMNELKQAIRTTNRGFKLQSLEYDDKTRTASVKAGW